MQTIAQDTTFSGITSSHPGSRAALRAGRVLSSLAVLFLAFDSVGKLLEVQPVIAGTTQLGYPAGAVFGLGVVELMCVVAYVIPRSAVLGAVLLTGYLGGAIATHVRVGSPLLTHTLFPIYIASLAWGGLFLRDARLRAFLPWRVREGRGVRVDTRGAAMNQAISKDGTAIAYERTGNGPALILVDGALCSRAFGPSPTLAPLLAQHFTVYRYDRRGRGDSGDTQPYSREREVDDIAALIREAGGSAFLVGLSSGAALALEAAAGGLDVRKVVAYEPPFVGEGQPQGGAGHGRHLKTLLAAGNRGGAVKYFMRSMVGVPAPAILMMRLMPWIWRKLEAVAHTLPYDTAVMNDFELPVTRLASIVVPTLVLHGSRTDDRLKRAAAAVAGAIPGSQQLALAGQTHNVKPAVLTPAVVKFFTA